MGSTGTYLYLTREERRRAIEAAVAYTENRVPLVVGIGALRTDETIRLAQDAKVLGAAVGLLSPVSYAPLSENGGLRAFFRCRKGKPIADLRL